MIVLNRLVADILDLDERNMTPILNYYGKLFNQKEVLQDIQEHNPELINTFCYYDQQRLLGYFRFSITTEGTVLIHSFQLVNGSKKTIVLRKLLLWAYSRLQRNDIPSETEIYTWTHIRNGASIQLQQKMGFTYATGNRDASKFITTKQALINTLQGLGFHRLYGRGVGDFPIRSLSSSLPTTFQMHRPENIAKLQRAIQEGRLNPAIAYIIGEEFKMIYVLNEMRQICVHEQFLAFLWSFIYSAWVIYEAGVLEPMQSSGTNTFLGAIDDSRLIVKRAKELYSWMSSLPKQYMVWPSHLPSPENFMTAEEQFYVEKAIIVYRIAVNYLLYHEVAHLINNHLPTLEEIRRTPFNERSEREISLHKTIEQEADRFAQEQLIDAYDDETKRLHTGLSIVLAHCAALFAVKHPSAMANDLHPDLDTRLFHSINFLGLQEPDKIDYIYTIAAMTINIYLGFNKKELDKIDFELTIPYSLETPEDYFTAYLELVDRLKIRYQEL